MKQWGIRRLFLHSATLEVALPDGEKIKVDAPLEASLSQALERLAEQQNSGYQESSE
jgi:23S rRNA pseudouridine955/2504/2580 synthase